MSIKSFFHEYRDIMNFCMLLLIIVVFIMWAYNLGHYDSLQYQKWYDDCVKVRGTMNLTEVFGDDTGININISVK